MNPISAIVVTFHPDLDVLKNLSALRPQVHHLIVVDNGSSADELIPLHEAAATLGFELIENGDNLGIATALNIGVRRAQQLGDPWVMLFDQDSRVTESFVETMLHAFQTSPWGGRLAVLVPRYVDIRLGSVMLPGLPVRGGGIEAATTSGSLTRLETFTTHGPFRDELFIDSVDYEHSLRLRKAGRVIDECTAAILLHAPGTPAQHRFHGRILFSTANYSPVRRYYQERNKIWVARHYFTSFPIFCLKLFKFSVKDFIKLLLAEDGRRRKVAFFLRGIMDGLRGRMGKLPEA